MDCFLWFNHIRSDSLPHRIRSDSVACSLVAIPPPASPPCPPLRHHLYPTPSPSPPCRPPQSPSASPSLAAFSAPSVPVRFPCLLRRRPLAPPSPPPVPLASPPPSVSLPPPSSSYHAWHQVRGRHRQVAARPAASPPGRRRRGRWRGASHLSDASTGKRRRGEILRCPLLPHHRTFCSPSSPQC